MTEPDVTSPQGLAATLHAELLERGMTIATAESLTGGGLADLITAAPGASETFVGGVVSYATEVKARLLGVSAATIEAHGVVSAPCATEMAAGARELLGADLAVSTTGVAGPTRQEDKPVGLVFLGIAGPAGTVVRELHLRGDRAEIRHEACRRAVREVLDLLGGHHADGETVFPGVGRAE
jgi:PncC family amidohydrolase